MSFTKKDILPWKLAIECDRKLSHGAARVGWRIGSFVYNHRDFRFFPEEPFPMTWRDVSRECFGMSEREVYSCLRELVELGYLVHCGVHGCPGKANYRIVFAKSSTAQTSSARTAQTSSARTAKCDSPSTARGVETSSAHGAGARAAQKRGPLISNSLREEIVHPMEQIGSLRSKGTNEEELAASPKAFEELSAKAKAHFTNWKQTKA